MKKIISILLVIVMSLTLLSACGNSENSGDKDTHGDTGTKAASAETNIASETTKTDDTQAPQDMNDVDEATIVVAFYAPRAISSEDVERVANEINKITVPAIQTSVKLIPLEQGNWDQQINLMITGNEQLDLLPTFFYGSTALTALLSQKQLTPLNDIIDEYGQDILANLPEGYINATTYNGNIYALPVNKANAGGSFCFMRKDILDELGLLDAAKNAASMQDIEAILKAVKEQTDLVPVVPASTSGVWNFANAFTTGAFADVVTYEDLLGGYIGIMSDQPDKVVNLYETNAYKESCKMLQRWYENGYIYTDAATNDQPPEDYISAGNAFCFFNGTELNALSTVDRNCGQEMVAVNIAKTPITTWSVNTITWTVPVTTREPEAAVKFLNFMYSDSHIVNMLNFGVEGTDYVVADDGRLAFPEGKDSNSVGYYVGYTWLFGNQFLAGVRDSEDPDIYENGKKYTEEAILSPNFGFATDSSGMDTEIAAMTSAKNEFVRGLNCGIGNADENIEQLNKKMKAAGVDDVVANLQSQLDEWKAAQK